VGNVEQIPFAYKVYKSRDLKDETLARDFKRTFCREVFIDFLGVWFVLNSIVETFMSSLIFHHRDTVASVGYANSIPTLPFVSTNPSIRVFRHALSLDEVRMTSRIHALINVNWANLQPITSPPHYAG